MSRIEHNEEEFCDTPRDVIQLCKPDVYSKQNVVDILSSDINQDFLIDLNQLVIGAMVSEGHYSIVYSGLYKSQPVAVKTTMPLNTAAVSPERKSKFEREVVMFSKVKHDNIVEFVGASLEPAMLIVTEFMGGGTLRRYLLNLRPKRPDLKVAISFALDISRAMEYLHSKGIIHRDLKPANLLLTNDMKKIKVADFGLAREETEKEKTVEAGTYRWMAPEVFNMEAVRKGEKKYYNHKVDIYSFSMVLWELLTNTTPFKGRAPILVSYAVANKMRPSIEDIPLDIVPLLESCWSDNPASRPEFSEVTAFLEKFHKRLWSMDNESSSISQAEESGRLAKSEYTDQEIIEVEQQNKRRPRLHIRCFSCSAN